MRLCKKCNEERSDNYFYKQRGKPAGDCKPCRGIKMKINNGLKHCNKCNQDKKIDEFYTRKYGEGRVPTGYCKSCMGIKYLDGRLRPYVKKSGFWKEKTDKQAQEREELKPIIREYIRRVIMRGYGIDVIDMYRIIHYHQVLWNNDQESSYIPFTLELKTKWNALEDWYNKNK